MAFSRARRCSGRSWCRRWTHSCTRAGTDESGVNWGIHFSCCVFLYYSFCLWSKKSSGPAEWEASRRICGFQKPPGALIHPSPWVPRSPQGGGPRWALGSFSPDLLSCDHPGWGVRAGPATLSQSTDISDAGKCGSGLRGRVCGDIFSPSKEQRDAADAYCLAFGNCQGCMGWN